MVLFAHNVNNIKGAVHKNSDGELYVNRTLMFLKEHTPFSADTILLAPPWTFRCITYYPVERSM